MLCYDADEDNDDGDGHGGKDDGDDDDDDWNLLSGQMRPRETGGPVRGPDWLGGAAKARTFLS